MPDKFVDVGTPGGYPPSDPAFEQAREVIAQCMDGWLDKPDEHAYVVADEVLFALYHAGLSVLNNR